ncbi:MAG: sigma-70 family RNA polymerase sigma factor [Muribaculaceae bacterium]|nr:sigma-70 family RNA polymerase sigma factor [Muribaculaceae bacterium]
MIFQFRHRSCTDLQIVEAYRTGDKRIQQFWYDKCRSQFGIGTARYPGLTDPMRDDLFQESFIILWEKMESGRVYAAGGSIHAISRKGDVIVPDLLGYFMRIVKNKYLELYHGGKYVLPINEVITSSGEDFFEELYWDEDPEVEKDRIVGQCLLALPKSCHEILTMFYYEKKTLEQILEERPENSSYDGLKSRKSKCMTNLKKRITESFAKAGLR